MILMETTKTKQTKKKEVIVLFSSGLDSTYLVYKNLMEGHTVRPVYVEIKNNENKSTIEKQNMHMLYELFQKYYDNIVQPVVVSEVMMNNVSSHLIFKQLPIWIFSIAYLSYYSVDEIQIAYVANDDALSYIDEIKKFYRAHKWLHTVKQPKLVFPLIKDVKREMMDKLPAEYKPYISSCENPQLQPYRMHVKNPDGEVLKKLQLYKPCGSCTPCERIIRDGLAYNELYGNMIRDHNEKIDLGREFFYLKNNKPEIFASIRKTLYPEIDQYKNVELESAAMNKVSA